MSVVLEQGSWSYSLSDDDLLWTARMLQGEGPVTDSAAVLWTMAQLFSPEGQVSKYSGPHRFTTFKALIQAYSQPINPIWRRDGSKCRPGGSHHSTAACNETRLARRDYYASLPYERVDAAKREVLEQWAAGRLDNPVPGATEFAHVSVIPDSRRMEQPVVWTSPSGNQFLRSKRPLTLPVTIGTRTGLGDYLDQMTPFAAALRKLFSE